MTETEEKAGQIYTEDFPTTCIYVQNVSIVKWVLVCVSFCSIALHAKETLGCPAEVCP